MAQDSDKTQIDPSGGPQGAKMKLGPYETTEVLGRGGMAVVYKGTQQSLGRVVAIKVLPKEFSRDRQFVGRFHREAESVAKLNHPNIIQIIDKGEENGICFFVMEYVKGTSLGARLANKGVTFKELIEIGLQVCSALHYAHEQGVVHRDIKPANILLDDTTGVAKVADFGIAQLAEKSTAIGTLTGDHMAMGTLDYMSPEQKRDAKNVDRRADIYSIGVMMYEMATGRVPMGIFDAPSRINKELPKDFDVIVMRCLRDKPDERFQTCLELAGALSALPQSPSTMVRVMTSVKSGVTNIGTELGRRNPRYIAAVFFLVAGLGIGSFAIWKWGPGKKAGGGSGPVADNGGGGTKPQDPTGPDTAAAAAAAAEKVFQNRMTDALQKAGNLDFKGALQDLEELKKTGGDQHLSDVARAVDKVQADEDAFLAKGFLDRLQRMIVSPADADSSYVSRLEALLAEADKAKMPDRVLNSIRGELASANTAVQVNAAAAAEIQRKKVFVDAIARIQKLVDDGEFESADTELGKISKDPRLPAEKESFERLTSQLAEKRTAAANADENKKTYDTAIAAAQEALKQDQFNKARLELKTAAAAGGNDKAAEVKALQDKVTSREREFTFAALTDEARKKEISEPKEAAKLYREAALDPPSKEEGELAIAKATKLEAGIREAQAQQDYDRYMNAARAAFAAHEWQNAMDEAAQALGVRQNDPDAAKLLKDARDAKEAKPPDPPKLLSFKCKGVVKGKFGSIKSIAVAPSGVLYATDEKLLKGFAIGTDLQVLTESKLPYQYPDRVFVDPRGTVWASEWGNLSTINRLNAETLAVEQTVGGKGEVDGKFIYLVDIVLSPDGQSIYGLESKGAMRLEKLSAKDGTFLAKSGGLFRGKGAPTPGMFLAPKNLAIDKDGRVYASDTTLKNIQRFKPDTSFDSVFVSTPEFVPGAMAWADDRLFVINLTLFRVDIYSSDAKFLGFLGEKGQTEMQFCQPTGISVSAGGKVYVVDKGTRITVWEEEK